MQGTFLPIVLAKDTVIYCISNTVMDYLNDLHWALQDNNGSSFHMLYSHHRAHCHFLLSFSPKNMVSIILVIFRALFGEGVSVGLSELSDVLGCRISSHFNVNFS